MRIVLQIVLLSLCLPASGIAQIVEYSPPPPSDEERFEILDFITSYYDALSDRDWDRFQSHFWEGATISTVWQAPSDSSASVFVTSVPEFVQQAPEGPGSREIFEERMESAFVRKVSNLASVFARYRARFGDPGNVAEWEGTDLFTLMRFENAWRITSLSFAGDE